MRPKRTRAAGKVTSRAIVKKQRSLRAHSVQARPGQVKSMASSMPKETLLAPGTDPFRPLHVAFDVLICRAVELMILGGLKPEEVERSLRAKADAYAQGKRRRATADESHFGLLAKVSGVMHDWWRETPYVGSDGNAKPLPIDGRGATLFSLVARRVPLSNVPAAIDWMERAALFTRDEEGRATAANRQAIIARGSPGPLMSERGLTMAAYALGTAAHNYKVKAKLPGYTDRQAYVSRLSLKHFRQFRSLVRLHGSVFLETIDNWLEDHQVKEPGESGIEAGVHLYMFSGRRAKARRSRRKGGAS